MRRSSPTGAPQARTREFGPHPVPQRAASFGHLGLYFASEGQRDVGGRMTGHEGASEMSRQLRPAMREVLFS